MTEASCKSKPDKRTNRHHIQRARIRRSIYSCFFSRSAWRRIQNGIRPLSDWESLPTFLLAAIFVGGIASAPLIFAAATFARTVTR
jgi:hypothetical protein